jgi:hypothetical protein
MGPFFVVRITVGRLDFFREMPNMRHRDASHLLCPDPNMNTTSSLPLFWRACALLLLLLVTACGRELSDAELLARDKADLADKLTSNKVLSYKFCKLILRSAAEPGAEDAKTREFQSIAEPLFIRIFMLKNGGVAALGVSDYLGLYTGYLELKDYVATTDEDIYPPLLEVFGQIYDSTRAPQPLPKEERLILQNVEHAALSGLVMLSKDMGRPIALYECAETEPQYLADGEVKTLLQFYRGFIFFQAGFYYVAHEALSDNISWLSAHQEVPLHYMQALFHFEDLQSAKAHIAYRALNYLLRGIDQAMMERDIDQERALEDFEHFIADAKEVGLDNELVWVVEAYLYMKREEHDKAIAALRKLRASPLLSSKEKDAIDETIGYLQEREPDKALNGVYDNVFMGKIVVSYMLARLAEVDWKALAKKHDIPYTEEIFATVDQLETTIQNIDRYTDLDTIAAVGMQVEKKAEEQGKSLLEKAKEWWEK